MQLKSSSLPQHLHLDEVRSFWSVRNTVALAEYFQLQHRKNYLNNKYSYLQFYCFLHYVTNLKKDQIMLLFDLLDRNGRGRICSNGCYLVACILLSHKCVPHRSWCWYRDICIIQLPCKGNQLTTANLYTWMEKIPGSRCGSPTAAEKRKAEKQTVPLLFEATKFLFNIQKEELKKILKDFDISGDKQVNYRESKVLAVFCIDNNKKRKEIMNSLPVGSVSS
ncbi:EF-hand calcium-binding domain-containing protein 9 [Cuculus canorus]|uniref:EF-hand calcium-binding domain-containing protein 9 n=1 Tax=Cuculus canorus TaxID=55661 RepID=UPI0023AA8FD1|nr:EF-hand calcium-binding domain-containing protein 9 [Cuculus canorus]